MQSELICAHDSKGSAQSQRQSHRCACDVSAVRWECHAQPIRQLSRHRLTNATAATPRNTHTRTRRSVNVHTSYEQSTRWHRHSGWNASRREFVKLTCRTFTVENRNAMLRKHI